MLENSPTIDFAELIKKNEILFKAPIASIVPPKTIAAITSHIVFSIPFMPPDEKRSFNKVAFVSMFVSLTTEFIIT